MKPIHAERYPTNSLLLVLVLGLALFAPLSGTGLNKFTDPQAYKQTLPGNERVIDAELADAAQRWQAVHGSTSRSPRGADYSDRMRTLVERLAQGPIRLTDPQGSFSQHADVNLKSAWGTPVFISAQQLAKIAPAHSATASPEDRVLSLIAASPGLFKLQEPRQELRLARLRIDRLGYSHAVFDQYFDGIPYWGQRLVGHFDRQGELYLFTGRYAPTPAATPTTPAVSAAAAIRIATTDLGAIGLIRNTSPLLRRLLDYDGPEANLYIWSARGIGDPQLVWQVLIRPNLRDRWFYFVDALDGEVLESYNNTQTAGPATATATDLNGVTQTIHSYEEGGVYRLIDASREIWVADQSDPFDDPEGAIITYDLEGQTPQWGQFDWISSGDNTWSDATAVSAHYHSGRVYQYYYDTHGRLAIDGDGGSMISVIHVAEDNGAPMDNAYWNGRYVSWGDGRYYFTPLAGALDVAAHEFTHGLIDYTVQLEYQFQSGALNESFADVGGALVDDDDWLIGEDIIVPQYFPSGAMRDMADPHNGAEPGDFDWQPAHMDEYVDMPLSEDNGGVHVNSGIPNKAAYLVATAIGREKMGAIYYRILDAHLLGRYAQFIDMRLAAIQAATELYGAESAEVQAVKDAFDAVGLGEGGGSEPPPDNPVVEGDEWIAFVNDESFDNSLFLGSPDNPPTLQQLSPTQVFTSAGKPIDASGDGSVLVFVDAGNNIRSINIDSGAESIISSLGKWSSVALSPDGSKLASTTIYADSVIYVLYLNYPDSSRAIRLYSPTTQDSVRDYITEYADVMDWDDNGEYLVFDAFNRVQQVGGDDLEFWEVNLLEVEQDRIKRLFPTQEKGVSMGNPAFASTNDLYLAFDRNDELVCGNEIVVVNLFEGTEGMIIDNGCVQGGYPNLGFPKFAPDDGMLVYQNEFLFSTDLRRIALAEDRLSPQGRSENWVADALLPHWFVRSSSVAVEDEESYTLPQSLALEQNFPNPFNASTVISYTLPRSAAVKLAVYDILGRKVATLVDEEQRAGTHRIMWDGVDAQQSPVASGVYLYRLQTPESVRTRKMVYLK
ncbi:MAG: M4 family metallopeptidase [bacterium]